MCINCFVAAERDVFDKLFEEAPEKLEPVKRVSVGHYNLCGSSFYLIQSLCQFATKVLQELDIVITDLDNQVSSSYKMVLRFLAVSQWRLLHSNDWYTGRILCASLSLPF